MQAGPPPHEWAPGNVPRLAGPAGPGLPSGRGARGLGASHGRAELGPRVNPQFAVDAGEVGFHRPRAEEQGLGDLLVCVPSGRGMADSNIPILHQTGSRRPCCGQKRFD